MAKILLFVIKILLVLDGIWSIQAANILFSALYGEGSHFLAASGIGQSLVGRGHNVTFLISEAYSHRASDPKFSNFSFEIFKHDIPVEAVRETFDAFNKLAVADLDATLHTVEIMKLLLHRMAEDCGTLLSDDKLLSRLKCTLVDAVVMDVTWPCALYIREILDRDMSRTKNITMVAVASTPPWRGFLQSAGSPFNFAYQPEMTTGFSNTMNIWNRIANVLISVSLSSISDILSTPKMRTIGMSHNLSTAHDLDATYSHVDFDLYLNNIDFSSDFPIPLTPNVIPVGGLTVTPTDNLEKDLETFMQSSGEHGVVVFTLGSYLASIVTIKPEIVEYFAGAFRRLPQKVIWQLKELPDWELPPNVKVMPWLPQNDILGHPKTRAFIFQGGNNGFQEACYHGVPMVVMPLHFDQDDVAARIVVRGLGKKIDKHHLSADIIQEAITEVISNPNYNAVAKQVSAMYKDKPMSPRDRAAFWIEHVMKFGGSYMRTPARELNFFQYHLLDVFGFLAAVFVVLSIILFYILRCCLRLWCSVIGRGGSVKTKSE